MITPGLNRKPSGRLKSTRPCPLLNTPSRIAQLTGRPSANRAIPGQATPASLPVPPRLPWHDPNPVHARSPASALSLMRRHPCFKTFGLLPSAVCATHVYCVRHLPRPPKPLSAAGQVPCFASTVFTPPALGFRKGALAFVCRWRFCLRQSKIVWYDMILFHTISYG